MMVSVQTEITDERPAVPRTTLFYDADCAFCCRWICRIKRALSPRGFLFVPLQDSRARSLPSTQEPLSLTEMRLLLPTGQFLGGADAVIELAKYIWWAWPLVALAQIPGMRHVLRAAYRYIAARRYCLSSLCLAEPNSNTQVNRHTGGGRSK